ncbi:MAG: YggS family pyridoxal phosphate-dependent enzyme [Candidatus Latescibacterota bacterium]
MDTVRHRWEAIQHTIARAAEPAGRSPADITVLAVTKNRSPEEVDEAIACGLSLLGENRVQEAEAKRPQVRGHGQWHLVGHLQTNKARRAVEVFDAVQSVDSLRVAQALDRHAGEAARRLSVLLQVNTSGAAGQSGVAPDGAVELAEQVARLPHLHLCGLMTIAALSPEESVVRGCFAIARSLRDRIAGARLDGVDMGCLSMGMSSDFAWAVAEGSTMLRLGTVLFGPRSA